MAADIEDLKWGLEQVRSGYIKPSLDRALPLKEAAEAHRLISNTRSQAIWSCCPGRRENPSVFAVPADQPYRYRDLAAGSWIASPVGSPLRRVSSAELALGIYRALRSRMRR